MSAYFSLTTLRLTFSVVVDRSEIAGVQPAVHDRAERGVFVAVIAVEDVGALEQQFAVVGDPGLDARQYPADGAELVLLDRRVGGDRRRLRHAVPLEHR